MTRISTTHVVEIGISIKSWNETQNFQNRKWVWANEIGRTIISLIANMNSVPTWYFSTLSRGIKKVNIVIFEENYGCLPRGDKGTELVFHLLLRKLSQQDDTGDYKFCHIHSDKESEIYNCCIFSGYGNQTLCSYYSSIVLGYAQLYIPVTTIIIVLFGLPLILKYLRSFKTENEHYHISDSPVALSTIFREVMIEEKGPVKSAQRRLIFLLIVTGILYFSEFQSTWVFVASAIWVIPFTAIDIFLIRYNTAENVANRIGLNDTSTIYITILTLPFNFRYWWNAFRFRFKIKQQNSNYQPIQNNQEDQGLPIWRKICHFFQDVFLISVYIISFIPICGLVCALLILTCFMTLTYPLVFRWQPILVDAVSAHHNNCIIKYCCILFLFFFSFAINIFNVALIICSVIPILNVTLLLIAGLYLNGEFYSPIVLPIMILVVYCWNGWRSFVESRYIRLKSKIYEVCGELANENSHAEIENDMPRNATTGLNNEENVNEIRNCQFTVNVKAGTVSKALYKELRETLLPYDEVLFWFSVRLFLVANFCLLMSVMMLLAQTSGISEEINIISTMAVGTLPFIFDTILAEHNSEQEKVADIKLKLTLRGMVKLKKKVDAVIMVEINCDKKRDLGFLNDILYKWIWNLNE